MLQKSDALVHRLGVRDPGIVNGATKTQLDEWNILILWVKQLHPPVITIFIGGMFYHIVYDTV